MRLEHPCDVVLSCATWVVAPRARRVSDRVSRSRVALHTYYNTKNGFCLSAISQKRIVVLVSFSEMSHSLRARAGSAAASFGLTAFMLSK